MSFGYQINFVILKKFFTRKLCSSILHELFYAHKEERADQFVSGRHWNASELGNPLPWMEQDVDRFYSNGIGGGVDLPYMNAASMIGAGDYADTSTSIISTPKDKMVVGIGVEFNQIKTLLSSMSPVAF